MLTKKEKLISEIMLVILIIVMPILGITFTQHDYYMITTATIQACKCSAQPGNDNIRYDNINNTYYKLTITSKITKDCICEKLGKEL